MLIDSDESQCFDSDESQCFVALPLNVPANLTEEEDMNDILDMDYHSFQEELRRPDVVLDDETFLQLPTGESTLNAPRTPPNTCNCRRSRSS